MKAPVLLKQAGEKIGHAMPRPVKAAWDKMGEAAGGPARLQIILLLASILALDSADKASVSAVAGSLKQPSI